MMVFATGMALGAGMILPIGAQNAHVLSCGLHRRYPLQVATICALCDMLLIFAGVMGAGMAITRSPLLLQFISWSGAAFLLWYGWLSLQSLLKPQQLTASQTRGVSFRSVLLATLAVTLLNPHVYLDTVVVLGAMGGQYADGERLQFALGAMTASILWFYSLGLGAARLSPWLNRAWVWRIIDALVWLLMWTLAGKLILSALAGT